MRLSTIKCNEMTRLLLCDIGANITHCKINFLLHNKSIKIFGIVNNYK